MPKVIQLTERKPEAVWKTKLNGKTVFMPMVDMEDRHLQAALVIAQKRQVEAFLLFMNDSKRVEQLKQVAKDRNLTIQDLDHIKSTYLGAKYMEFGEVMLTAYSSIKRKIKQLNNIVYDTNTEKIEL